MNSLMRDLRKALGDVYSEKKNTAASAEPPATSPAPLDEDLAKALSAALAEVPSLEQRVGLAPSPLADDMSSPSPSPSPFSFNVAADLPEMELVEPEMEFDLDDADVDEEIDTAEPQLVIEPEPEPEPGPEPEPFDHEVKPSAPRPTPKMAAWLSSADKPGAMDPSESGDGDSLPMPTEVWQLSDDDILPARSSGGRRFRR